MREKAERKRRFDKQTGWKKGEIGAIAAIIVIILIFMVYEYYTDRIKKSTLYYAVSSYLVEGEEWAHPRGRVYPEQSAEGLFLKGMDAYTIGEYEKAEVFFQQALEKRKTDPALSAYLYLFQNECSYSLKGIGDYELIAKGIDAAEQYRPHIEDGHIVVRLLNTITFNSNAESPANEFIEEYINLRPDLELNTWVRLKNFIGMEAYTEGNYAKSIRNFYDVQIALEEEKSNGGLIEQLNFAREYIANIYYLFTDYENAIRLYRESMDNFGKDNIHLFSTYMNIATAALKLEDVEEAKKAVNEIEKVLLQFEGEVFLESEACVNDLKAMICLREGRLSQAKDYARKAEEGYSQIEDKDNAIYFGGEYFVQLTKAKIMLAEKKAEEAKNLLITALEKDKVRDYGLEYEFYEILLEAYQQLGDKENELEIAKILLKMDEEEEKSVRTDYLGFATYYRDIQREKIKNEKLVRSTAIAMSSTGVFFGLTLVLIYILRKAGQKNMTDQLTGVYNRRKLEKLDSRFERTGTPQKLGVIMLDIDYFKRYNDTYGHDKGDETLKETARVLKNCVRKQDILIRYGGEEFLIILNNIEIREAEKVCLRIKEKIEEAGIAHKASETADHITLSMGMCYQEQAQTERLFQLIREADKCLYRTKERGRNGYTIKELRGENVLIG